ncbi:MAG: sodium:solute symporter [Candidatus Methylacidiphilales bacterium]|nr:sodium:solute symporter [Candidatus Methylacidiphilales bacterium]
MPNLSPHKPRDRKGGNDILHRMHGWMWDAVVISAYAGMIAWIGWSQRRGGDDVRGFALGDRNMPWWAVLASILAAEISAATFLGAPGEGFAKRNFTYAQLAIGTILARLIVGALFIPAYYRHGVVSIYEFLEIRFGPRTRSWASATFLVTRLLASGTRLYVSAILVALAFEMATGSKPSPAGQMMIYAGAVVVVTLATAIYTAIGGIKAVIWTDLLQVGVLAAAVCFSIYYLLSAIPGGLAAVTGDLSRPGDMLFLTWGQPEGTGAGAWVKMIFEEEYTLWTALLGATFVTLATHGTDQDMVQRMLTAPDKKRSAWAVVLSGIIDMPVVLSFLFIGILLSVFYQVHPDPNLPDKNPHVFPYFILHEMPPGLRGLVVAGVLATAMGSLSTALNALATSFCRDWLGHSGTGEGQTGGSVRAMQTATWGFAALLAAVGIATAWAVIHIPGSRIIPIVLGIFGYTYGSLLGVFLVGLATRTRGSDTGNAIAMASGFVVVAWLCRLPEVPLHALGIQISILPEWMPTLAFPWRVTAGTLVTVLVALAFHTPTSRMESMAASPARD